MEHKKEKRNERAAIQLGLFLVGLLLFGTAAGGQLTGEEKNGKEKAAIQTSGGVSDAAEPKKIALTFDDGPHPVYTKILLDGLAERGAKASFFVTGENAEKYPELILRMQKEGHLIGNHTYSHIPLDWCSQSSTNVEKRILSKARENAIILLHDEYASSIEAALFIVDELQSQGYVFVTVEEIMLVS